MVSILDLYELGDYVPGIGFLIRRVNDGHERRTLLAQTGVCRAAPEQALKAVEDGWTQSDAPPDEHGRVEVWRK